MKPGKGQASIKTSSSRKIRLSPLLKEDEFLIFLMVSGNVVNPTASLNKDEALPTDLYSKTINCGPPLTHITLLSRDLTVRYCSLSD